MLKTKSRNRSISERNKKRLRKSSKEGVGSKNLTKAWKGKRVPEKGSFLQKRVIGMKKKRENPNTGGVLGQPTLLQREKSKKQGGESGVGRGEIAKRASATRGGKYYQIEDRLTPYYTIKKKRGKRSIGKAN